MPEGEMLGASPKSSGPPLSKGVRRTAHPHWRGLGTPERRGGGAEECALEGRTLQSLDAT